MAQYETGPYPNDRKSPQERRPTGLDLAGRRRPRRVVRIPGPGRHRKCRGLHPSRPAVPGWSICFRLRRCPQSPSSAHLPPPRRAIRWRLAGRPAGAIHRAHRSAQPDRAVLRCRPRPPSRFSGAALPLPAPPSFAPRLAQRFRFESWPLFRQVSIPLFSRNLSPTEEHNMYMTLLILLSSPITWLIAMMLIAAWSRMMRGPAAGRRDPARTIRTGSSAPDSLGSALMFLSMAYRPNHAFVAKAQIVQREDEDDDNEGGPDTPQRHLHRQLRRIRRGQPVDRLVWRLE